MVLSIKNGVVLLLLATTGLCTRCEKDAASVSDQHSGEIVLVPNVAYEDEKLGVRLVASHITDSRCPINANCVWAGNAAARFDLVMNRADQHQFNLGVGHLIGGLRSDTLIQGLTFKLRNITPYPSDKTTEPEDYRVIVSISK